MRYSVISAILDDALLHSLVIRATHQMEAVKPFIHELHTAQVDSNFPVLLYSGMASKRKCPVNCTVLVSIYLDRPGTPLSQISREVHNNLS